MSCVNELVFISWCGAEKPFLIAHGFTACRDQPSMALLLKWAVCLQLGVAAPEEELSEEKLCVICLVNRRDTTVLPCRHLCMCQECAQARARPANVIEQT